MKVINGWVDTAVEIDYGNKSMGRNGWKPLIIVLHGTAGGSSAQDIAYYFRDGTEQASAHFVIGQDGTVVQGISCDVAAWGNGLTTAGHAPFLPDSNVVNGNWYTISIEHCKPSSDNSDQLTDAQKASSFALCDALCSAYGIPRKVATDMNGGILGHHDFDPVNRSRCPGPYPTDELIASLNNGGNDMLDPNDLWVQAHFKILAPDRWHCIQTGFDVAYGNLGYYRTIQAAPRLPVGPEQKDASGRTWQPFEGGIIIYDTVSPSKPNMPSAGGNCYLEKLDSPLALQLLGGAVSTQVAALQAQVTTKNKALAQIANEAATASK